MPWSIDIDEFTSEGVSHTLAPDGTATFELTGRYSAHHIVRVPQLPLLELHDAEGGGLDEPVLRAETVSFTMWPVWSSSARSTSPPRGRRACRNGAWSGATRCATPRCR